MQSLSLEHDCLQALAEAQVKLPGQEPPMLVPKHELTEVPLQYVSVPEAVPHCP
jgi:hypothetical protein